MFRHGASLHRGGRRHRLLPQAGRLREPRLAVFPQAAQAGAGPRSDGVSRASLGVLRVIRLHAGWLRRDRGGHRDLRGSRARRGRRRRR